MLGIVQTAHHPSCVVSLSSPFRSGRVSTSRSPGGVLPPTLKILRLVENFNRPINAVVWPAFLEEIWFGSSLQLE